MLRSRKLCWKDEASLTGNAVPAASRSKEALATEFRELHLVLIIRQGSFYAASERLSAPLRVADSLVWQAARRTTKRGIDESVIAIITASLRTV